MGEAHRLAADGPKGNSALSTKSLGKKDGGEGVLGGEGGENMVHDAPLMSPLGTTGEGAHGEQVGGALGGQACAGGLRWMSSPLK